MQKQNNKKPTSRLAPNATPRRPAADGKNEQNKDFLSSMQTTFEEKKYGLLASLAVLAILAAAAVVSLL
jgi:hypothetical protein